MYVSELIEYLNETLEQYGDIPVWITGSTGCYDSPVSHFLVSSVDAGSATWEENIVRLWGEGTQ